MVIVAHPVHTSLTASEMPFSGCSQVAGLCGELKAGSYVVDINDWAWSCIPCQRS